MGNALFIVWRESVEAMLVIGILFAWIRDNGEGRIGLRHLWFGVGGGVALAGALAVAMMGVQSQLAGNALELFQAGILFVAAGLLTHMVMWMRHHARFLKRNLQQGLSDAAERTGGVAVAVLAAIAVGREGAETVLFLYGLGVEQDGGALARLLGGAGIGFALALVTAWLIQKGSRWLPSRVFFRITEVLLLLLASALLVSGAERLINMEWLPPLLEPVWDSSALLDEGSSVGNLIASFTGYRSRPSLMVLLVWLGYWAVVWWLGRSPRTAARPAAKFAN